MKMTVGVGELLISADKEDIITTYSLGSCLGLAIYDPVAAVGGILHAQLPHFGISVKKAVDNPAMFVDTGMEMLFNAAYSRGAKKNRLAVKLAGCNCEPERDCVFRIGERNYIMARRLLWKNNVFISGEDVGGNISRTMSLDIRTGMVMIKKGAGVLSL